MVHTTFYYGLQVKKNKKLFSFYNHMEFLLEIPPSCRISEFGRGKNREFVISTAEKKSFPLAVL